MNGTPAPNEQQALLEAEIAAAQARVATARQLATLRDADMRAALRAELDASRAALAAMELEYETTITSIREEARLEVDRILAEARSKAVELPVGGRSDAE
ncbi:MAG: hypothetical protein K8R99_02015 [Actinomycetia bacterium]|nr:hypothetical protein [Actinomycetes bacterium]